MNDEVRSQSIGIVLAAIIMTVCAGPVVSAEPAPVKRVVPWDIFPSSPWNYGLTLKDGFQVIKADWPAGDQPFRNEAAPVRLIAKAKKIPNWTLDRNGAVQEVTEQPVQSDEPEESITMIPMGAASHQRAAGDWRRTER
jgi:hypothetical protein